MDHLYVYLWIHMKPLLIPLDEQPLAALNRVAPPGNRYRSEFVRQAIRQAIRRAEHHAMRDAYPQAARFGAGCWPIGPDPRSSRC
jgi:hypothetical protein